MGIFDHFVQTLTEYLFESKADISHYTNINTHFIELYVSIIKLMANVDGEIAKEEHLYYQNIESSLFDKNNEKLFWNLIPGPLYEQALQRSKGKWENPYTLSKILDLTDSNLALRKDLFEIACITAGADHKFLKQKKDFWI
jgi:hypothetical protein